MVSLSSASKITSLVLFNLFFIILHDLVRADPPYQLCQGTTFTDTSPFQKNLNDLLSSLSSNASVTKFYNTSIGNDLDTVYGLFFCYGYVEKGDCVKCIAAASQNIRKLCRNKKEAVVWEENCQLRYSNQNFVGHLDVDGNINQTNPKNVSDPKRLQSLVNITLHNISNIAAFSPSSGMYATQDVPFSEEATVYALVQCTVDLSPDECNTCLEIAISNISSCCYFYRGTRLLSRSCYLRYEFYHFYKVGTECHDSAPCPDGDQQNKWMVVVLAIGSATVVAALICFCIYCLVLRNQTKNKKGRFSCQEVQLPEIDEPNMRRNFQGRENLDPQEFPFIPMDSIKAATDNFSDSNKLGQGGFGPVFKGILPGGEEIAVKRLSASSDQGSDEFINEVLLILKLQHKNLVRLLGFCVQGEEKLLVYEYMCNSSLDFFLNDQSKRAQLNWSLRLDIINGIARGMLYLHQDSRLRIIHRDLKPSNVLLDKDMNPKISDFGMARIFGDDDRQDNSTAKIVGTYGYIAPEFAMEGLYSIKSDVFSFGVLLLEIISGKRNAGFYLSKHAPSLLSYAWQLWNEGRGKDLMDPVMPDTCCLDDFLRCMHIGLLCVQEDAYDRPTMSSVVIMLKSDTVTPSQPQRPAYSVGRLPDHQKTCYNNLSINNFTVSNIHPR